MSSHNHAYSNIVDRENESRIPPHENDRTSKETPEKLCLSQNTPQLLGVFSGTVSRGNVGPSIPTGNSQKPRTLIGL